MRRRTFFINGLILTAASLALRYVGIWYNVFVTDRIGADGMGLFQLALSVYSLAATFATSGISISVTRLISADGPRSVGAVMKSGVTLSLGLSLCAAAALYMGSAPVAALWLGDSRAEASLRVFAFALVAISVSGCVNGYFLATRKIARSTAVQVFEQAVRIAATMLYIGVMKPSDVGRACSCAAMASVTAEYASMAAGICVYRVSRALDRRKAVSALNARGGYAKRLAVIMAPIAASAYVRAGLRTVENLLTPWGLRMHGHSRTDALAQYGVLKAMVMPIIYFPGTIVSSFATLLIPELAELSGKRDCGFLTATVRRVYRVTLSFAIFCAVGMAFFAGPLCLLVYNDYGMAWQLRAMSVLVPLMYLDNVTDAMLNALNQQVSALKINMADSIARVALMALLMPRLGLNGYIVVIFVSTCFNAALSVRRLLKVTGARVMINLWVVRPLMAALPSVAIMLAAGNAAGLMGAWGLIFEISAAAALYLLLLRLFGVADMAGRPRLKGILDLRAQNTPGQ